MSIEQRISDKILNELQPLHFEIENESHKHAHGGAETHFKLLVVSEKFLNMNRVTRQRFIYDLLKEEIAMGVHALAQKTLTPEEWSLFQQAVEVGEKSDFQSPNCHSKKHL